MKVTKAVLFSILAETTDQSSIDAARATVEAKLEGAGLNLLINNAAIHRGGELDTVTAEDMVEVYKVNCVAPLMIVKVGSVKRKLYMYSY